MADDGKRGQSDGDAEKVLEEAAGLKPCPFCGGEAKRVTLGSDDGPGNEGGDVIVCTGKCGASSHVEFGYKENLVSLWNDRVSPPADAVAARMTIADAITQADGAFRYSFNLTRLVDGEETHTLTMPGFEPVNFEDRDEGYALIAERRNRARTDAILAAIGQLDLSNGEEVEKLRKALEAAHDELHKCTAVLPANDSAKVAVVMKRCREALASTPPPGAPR